MCDAIWLLERKLMAKAHSLKVATFSWNMAVYTDSDWVGDNETC
jgi:hypothetical protein